MIDRGPVAGRLEALPAALLLAVGFAGCSGMTESIDPEILRQEIEAYRAERLERLQAADGWLSLVALHWLEPGEVRFGSDAGLELVLPEGALPPRAGRLRLDGGEVTVQPLDRTAMSLGGAAVSPEGQVWRPVEAGGQSLRVGRLELTLIDRSGRLALRVKDPESPARRDFSGLQYFPIDRRWHLAARFQPYEEPRTLKIPTVQGSLSDIVAPGTLELTLDHQDFSLQAFAESADADEFFVIFKDQTNGESSYGAGRYVYAQRDGDHIRVDFNRAYNPPCAFSDFATCPLAPRQNWMQARIEAGERTYAPSRNH